jgi:hypothetical protein
MQQARREFQVDRRHFIGRSDARIIMGQDEVHRKQVHGYPAADILSWIAYQTSPILRHSPSLRRVHPALHLNHRLQDARKRRWHLMPAAPWYHRPMKGASTIGAELSVWERVLLFYVTSRAEWTRAGVTGATATAMIVKGLIERSCADPPRGNAV